MVLNSPGSSMLRKRPAREVEIEDEKEEKAKKKKKKRRKKKIRRRTKERKRDGVRTRTRRIERKGEIGEASLSRCIAIQACVRARDSAPEGILLISRGPLRKVICTIRK